MTIQDAQNKILAVFNNNKTPVNITGVNVSNFSIIFELEPLQGVTVSKIKRLLPDLSIYVKNPTIEVNNGLFLKIDNTFSQRQFYDFVKYAEQDTTKKIPLYFGITEDNKKLVVDLAKLPHLLVAGATGSGKSVFMHDCILSLLNLKAVNLLLIDPKKVEYSKYKNVIGCDVRTEYPHILQGLQNAVALMYSRYEEMEKKGIVDGHCYYMPYIVIIDELADLMLNKAIKKDVEMFICRLAQMGRACNIHLIIATQRPSVNVLTGLIKANIPCRVAFTCASAIDSRCIIDRKGAETLTGCGDGLLMQADGKTFTRFQAYSVDENTFRNYHLTYNRPTQTKQKRAGLFKRLFCIA